jgi:hypothetical protein
MTYSEYQVNNYPVELTTFYIDNKTNTYYTPKTYEIGEIPLRLVEVFEKVSGKSPVVEKTLDTSKEAFEPKLVVTAPIPEKLEATDNPLNITDNVQAKVERNVRKAKPKV